MRLVPQGRELPGFFELLLMCSREAALAELDDDFLDLASELERHLVDFDFRAIAALLAAALLPVLHLRHHFVEVETGGLVTGRELLEARQPLGAVGSRGSKHERVIERPLATDTDYFPWLRSAQSWATKSCHAHARTPGATARVGAGVFGD